MKISRKMFLTTVASVCLTATVQAQSLKEINFGIISTDSSSALKSLWQPFLDDMSKATGLKINGFFCHRLHRHHRGDAIWQGSGGLAWQ